MLKKSVIFFGLSSAFCYPGLGKLCKAHLKKLSMRLGMRYRDITLNIRLYNPVPLTLTDARRIVTIKDVLVCRSLSDAIDLFLEYMFSALFASPDGATFKFYPY